LALNEGTLKLVDESKNYKGKSKDEKRQLKLLQAAGAGIPKNKSKQSRLNDLQHEVNE